MFSRTPGGSAYPRLKITALDSHSRGAGFYVITSSSVHFINLAGVTAPCPPVQVSGANKMANVTGNYSESQVLAVVRATVTAT